MTDFPVSDFIFMSLCFNNPWSCWLSSSTLNLLLSLIYGTYH